VFPPYVAFFLRAVIGGKWGSLRVFLEKMVFGNKQKESSAVVDCLGLLGGGELLPKAAQLWRLLLDAQSQRSPRRPSANHMGGVFSGTPPRIPKKKKLRAKIEPIREGGEDGEWGW
jgi:hypothetical protein